MVTKKSPSIVPPLKDVAVLVLQDLMRERKQEQMEELLEDVLKRYHIDRSDLLSQFEEAQPGRVKQVVQ